MRLHKTGADLLGKEGQKLAAEFWQMTIDFSGGNPELMKSFFSMGIDAKNWSEDAKNLGDAVGDFMSVAMYNYLKNHSIPVDSITSEYAP